MQTYRSSAPQSCSSKYCIGAADVLSDGLVRDLRLARSSGATAGAGTRRLGVTIFRGVDLAVGKSGNVRDLSVLKRARRFAARRPLSVLLVGSQVEGDEKDKVRADDCDA